MANDWLHYLPEERRRAVSRNRRRLRRLQILRRRSFWQGLCLLIYGTWCVVLIARGNTLTFGFALVPLLSMPAIGWLAWWLVYKEFHD